jgi:predicted nuclease of predicted toxin-antitoxin system
VKIKLDENVPVSAASRLVALGHDVDTVVDEGLAGRSDADVWAGAQAEGRFLVTHDLDFSDARRFEPGTHSGILLIRLPDAEQHRVADFLTAWFSSPEAPSWGGCLVVATNHKVRVRRPSSTSTS